MPPQQPSCRLHHRRDASAVVVRCTYPSPSPPLSCPPRHLPPLLIWMDIGEDWVELATDNSWITPGFIYPKVVETNISFKALRDAISSPPYGWTEADVVELKYFNSVEQKIVPLTCDEHLGLLFTLNAQRCFGKILVDLLQPRGNARDSGKGVGKSCVSTNNERRDTPGRSKPSKASGSESNNMTAASSCANSPVVAYAVNVEQDAERDEEVPRLDDEDEKMYPKLVDKVIQQVMEDEYQEEPITGARFDDTNDEEREENIDSLVNEYDGNDMPTIEWNKEDPQLAIGTVFQLMVDYRNAVTTFCILTENDYVVIRSEPKRFTVKFPYTRCRWKLHISNMLRSKVIQTTRKTKENRYKAGEEGRVPKQRKCKKCGTLGHIARTCTNVVDASFGEEERWAAANAEENAAGEEIATIAEKNAVETLSEFEAKAYEGFEALRDEEEALIPFRIVGCADDRQMVITCSGSAPSSCPTPPP
ncbi:hypothetical protein D1007_24349 [Hordeum vulgare]|nr:hypothetical protein D1007_24349 [Hordeum vulgare]